VVTLLNVNQFSHISIVGKKILLHFQQNPHDISHITLTLFPHYLTKLKLKLKLSSIM